MTKPEQLRLSAAAAQVDDEAAALEAGVRRLAEVRAMLGVRPEATPAPVPPPRREVAPERPTAPVADDEGLFAALVSGMSFESFVRENPCPRCKRPKPVAAKACGACESRDRREHVLAAARASIPERLRSATVDEAGVVLGPRRVMPRAVLARVRPMLAGSGLIRGAASMAMTALAALLGELLDEAAWVEAKSDADWRVDPLVVRASRVRWMPALVFDEPQGRGDAPLGESAARASILVIADLVPETMTFDGATIVSGVVRRRRDAGKPTIVTTGATREELSRRFGASFEEALTTDVPLLDLNPRAVGTGTPNGNTPILGTPRALPGGDRPRNG